jgi:hypothetical protein
VTELKRTLIIALEWVSIVPPLYINLMEQEQITERNWMNICKGITKGLLQNDNLKGENKVSHQG